MAFQVTWFPLLNVWRYRLMCMPMRKPHDECTADSSLSGTLVLNYVLRYRLTVSVDAKASRRVCKSTVRHCIHIGVPVEV